MVRADGARSLRLRWKSSAFDWEPVPASALSHTPVKIEDSPECPASKRELSRGGNPSWYYNTLLRHGAAALNAEERAEVAQFLAGGESAARPRRANEVDVGKGGELFGTLGCSNCHALKGIGSKYALAMMVEAELRHRPGLSIAENEAVAIAAYLVRLRESAFEKIAPQGDAGKGRAIVESARCSHCHGAKTVCVPKAPVHELPLAMDSLGCNQCHRPGTEAPLLDGVGEKLKTGWIGQVLWGKQRIRPGREMRMPNYDRSDVEWMAAAFAKAEGLAPGDGPASPVAAEDRRQKGMGWLGTNPRKQGMSCIGCHDWGEYKSLGEEGPQLINAAERMRWDWFERWMRNPARILSGTSMPNYFGSMPHARAEEMIGTLWAGLELGKKAPVPDGYRVADLGAGAEAKPVPGKEAIVIRWDMPESTPAAIAVGLPGKLSYCFDAGRSQVLYAWQGGFVDLTDTLLKKTDKNRMTPTAALVGDIIYRSKEFPIRVSDRERIPQRKFKGYRLVGGVPEFHYQVDGIDVYEKLSPLADGKAILREVTFSRVDGPVWFEGREVTRGTNVKVEARIPQ